MFRARTPLFLAALGALFLAVTAARAQEPVQTVDGVMYVDYRREPTFNVGTWVSYQYTAVGKTSPSDAFELILRIGGEEKFWGEDCFWLESELKRGEDSRVIASCVTYDAFGDSLSDQTQLFERKTILGVDEDGKPEENLMWREKSSYKFRQKPEGWTVLWDTLGVDTVITPKGTFNCLKVVRKEGVIVTKEVGDSTLRGETIDTRTYYYSHDVPITSMVREDVETLMVRKAWKAGESENMIETIHGHGTATTRLLDWGEGATATFVPEAFRRPIKRSKTRALKGPGG